MDVLGERAPPPFPWSLLGGTPTHPQSGVIAAPHQSIGTKRIYDAVEIRPQLGMGVRCFRETGNACEFQRYVRVARDGDDVPECVEWVGGDRTHRWRRRKAEVVDHQRQPR